MLIDHAKEKPPQMERQRKSPRLRGFFLSMKIILLFAFFSITRV